MNLGWIGAYAAVNAFAFLVFGWDKRCARRGTRRIPESRLHLLALAGGFVGAWLAMRVFHHKTHKPVFTLVLALALLAHGVAWAVFFFR